MIGLRTDDEVVLEFVSPVAPPVLTLLRQPTVPKPAKGGKKGKKGKKVMRRTVSNSTRSLAFLTRLWIDSRRKQKK